ncbi:hypothetical protein [uncultured Winogradskyella sp.]|uniref:hypothetical protein n=1 Tax=uncultured Winogradskyella sp. TaxID=395353 RepID=UPI002612D8D8|nr:hypothetical protein [uncultured Winogradskyella sp.]
MKKNLFTALLCAITKLVFTQNIEQKADELYALGNYSKAIEVYKSVKNPNEVYDKIAKAYVAIGNYGEGLVNYKKAITTNPENILLKYEYAKLLRNTRDYKQAEILFKSLIIKDSLNPNSHYELGIVLEKQKDSASLNAYTKAFNLDSTHQKAIFKIAKHYLVKRKYQTAHYYIDIGLESYTNNVELISLKA